MVANPAASLPEQMGEWAQLKAAYPLLNTESITHTALTQPHCQGTIESAKATKILLVLFCFFYDETFERCPIVNI